MADTVLWLIRRQIYKGIHSGRRLEVEYLIVENDTWTSDRTLASTFDEKELQAVLERYRVLNQRSGTCISTIAVPL